MKPWERISRNADGSILPSPVLLSRVDGRAIRDAGLVVALLDGENYPCLVRNDNRAKRVAPLHVWVKNREYLAKHPDRRGLPDDCPVHHKNHNRFDARRENLELLVSSTAHNHRHQFEKQNFGPRKKFLNDLYRPHAPSSVRHARRFIGMNPEEAQEHGLPLPPLEPKKLSDSPIKKLEKKLAPMLRDIAARVDQYLVEKQLDADIFIEKDDPRYRESGTRRMGIRRPYRVSAAGAALVGLMILHHCSVLSVARELNVPAQTVLALANRPSIHQAWFEHWREEKLLPYLLMAAMVP